jgi:hypothetical protein
LVDIQVIPVFIYIVTMVTRIVAATVVIAELSVRDKSPTLMAKIAKWMAVIFMLNQLSSVS